MGRNDWERSEQLRRIAELLGCSVEAFESDEAGLRSLGDVVRVWPVLTERDRRDIVVLARGRAALREGPETG